MLQSRKENIGDSRCNKTTNSFKSNINISL